MDTKENESALNKLKRHEKDDKNNNIVAKKQKNDIVKTTKSNNDEIINATVNKASNSSPKNKDKSDSAKNKGEQNADGKKMRVRDYIYWALSILLIGLLIVCVILFAIGFRPAVVLTPSMKPTINPGSLVLVKSIDADKIKVGDVVMFWPTADGATDDDEISVTHRVVEIQTDESTGNLIFITHGDANSEGSTEKVPQSQIIGKVHLAIPVVGILFLFIKNNLFVVIFGVIAIICLWYLISMIIKNNKEKKATAIPNGNNIETTSTPVEPTDTIIETTGEIVETTGEIVETTNTQAEILNTDAEPTGAQAETLNTDVETKREVADQNSQNNNKPAKNSSKPAKNSNNTPKN